MLKFFGSAKALPSRKLPFHHSLIADRYPLPFTIRYSPFAVISPFANRQSPFAAVFSPI